MFSTIRKCRQNTRPDVVDPAESIAPIFRPIRHPQNSQSAIFANFGYFLPIFEFLGHRMALKVCGIDSAWSITYVPNKFSGGRSGELCVEAILE